MEYLEDKKLQLKEKIKMKKRKIDSGYFNDKFLISSKPYIRKNNVISDKGMN